MRNSSMIPYNVYCDLLDYIGENYHNLKEETLAEDWWSDLSPSEQGKYMDDHPNSEKARTAREKEKEQGSDDTPSKSNTQSALKDLKTHVDSVSKSVGVSAKLVTKAFKEPSVYNTVNALGGSVNAAAKSAIGGLRTIGKTLNVGGAVVTDTKAFKQLEKGIIKADEFMDKYPALKVVGSAALVAMATKQWLDMSFSGDIESDYDLGIIADAAQGKAKFADFIGTPEGVKGVALLGAGIATGGAPIWIGGMPVGLGLALAYSGLKKAGETEAGKKVKAKMVAMGRAAKDKVQKGAAAVDKKLGINKEEKIRFSTLYASTVLPKKIVVIEEDTDLHEKSVNVVQRRKLARRMSRMARSRAFQLKKKRTAVRRRSPEKIALIARKQSIKMFRDKFYPGYKDMAFAQRVKIDQLIMQKYGPRIDKIAKKKAMILKKGESERIAKARDAIQGSTSDDD